MSDDDLSFVEGLELLCIQEDALFFAEMMIFLKDHSMNGIIIPSMIPYYSLFTIESYQYFQKQFHENTLKLSSFEPIIRRSRMCIKLLEDSKKQINNIFDSLNLIVKFYRNYHIESHTGKFAALKKLLQMDLGLFIYDSRIIGSNYTGLFNLGFSQSDLAENAIKNADPFKNLSFNLGYELGHYIGEVLLIFGKDITNIAPRFFDYRLEDELFGYIDKKGETFLKMIFDGSGNISLNFALLVFLTQMNFMLQILSNLSSVHSYTLFKIKYLIAYHSYVSFKKLQNYCYRRNLLTKDSKFYLQEIIAEQDFKRIINKNLRNALVHYSLEGFSKDSVMSDVPLFGIVEYFTNGKSYFEIVEQVDEQIGRVRSLLEKWFDWEAQPHQIKSW